MSITRVRLAVTALLLAGMASLTVAWSELPATTSDARGPHPALEPVGDLVVAGSGDLAAAVERAPPDTTIVVGSGVHRLEAALRPAAGVTLIGQPGAVLSGFRRVDDFERHEGRWIATGVVPDRPRSTADGIVCRRTSPACDEPVQVFIDGAWVPRAPDGVALGAGSVHIEGDALVLGGDPGNRSVEITSTPQAILPSGPDVTVQNLVIEGFAGSAQEGVITATAPGLVVRDCEVRHNSGVGVELASDGLLEGSRIHGQGQMGVKGAGDDIRVIDNEIAGNNVTGFNDYWEAGGTKFVYTRRLVLRDNWVHDNDGPGLWTDIENDQTAFVGNRVERNGRSGILHEISYRAVIHDNVVRDNGRSPGIDPREGAGIVVATSSGVRVTANTVSGNAAGIVLRQRDRGDYELSEVEVRDNAVHMPAGFTGVAAGGRRVQGITFTGNTYRAAADAPFLWAGERLSLAEWQRLGLDVDAPDATIPTR